MLVAILVGGDARGLLIGEAPHDEREGLREVIAVRIDFADHLPASYVEALADQIDRDLRGAVPTVAEVFLDPTRRWARRVGSDGAAASGG